MTGQPHDFAPEPVRTAGDYSAWGGGDACCPGAERAWGGAFFFPTYGHGEGLAPGQGISSPCAGDGDCA